MDVVISTNFDSCALGEIEEFTDGYLTVRAKQKFFIVQADRSWFPFIAGKCLKFEGANEEDPDEVEIDLPPRIRAVNLVMYDPGDATRNDILFEGESFEFIPSQVQKSGLFRLASCLSLDGPVRRIRFSVFSGIVFIDNVELFVMQDIPLFPSEERTVYEHFDEALYSARVQEVETPLLKIVTEGFLKVTSENADSFPYTFAKFVLVSGAKESPRGVTIKLRKPALSIRFALRTTGSAIKGAIDFHNESGDKLGSTTYEPDSGQVVAFESKSGIDEIRFTAVGDLTLDTFEIVLLE